MALSGPTLSTGVDTIALLTVTALSSTNLAGRKEGSTWSCVVVDAVVKCSGCVEVLS